MRIMKSMQVIRLIQKAGTVIIAALLMVACSSVKESVNLRDQYVDVLNIKKIPSAEKNLDAFGFSDRGAWHAYSLPPDDSVQYYAGFCGPLLMKNSGRWLGKISSQLVLIGENGVQLEWLKEKSEIHYYPGKLEQLHSTSALRAEQSLVFADERTALIVSAVTNFSKEGQKFRIKLRSRFFKQMPDIVRSNNQILVSIEDGSIFCLTLPDNQFDFEKDSTGFTITLKKEFSLMPGKSMNLNIAESYFFNKSELTTWKVKLDGCLKAPESVMVANAKRWNGYFSKIFENGNKYLDTVGYKRLAVKCVQTLLSNWRSPAGALKHNGVFPSTAYQGFYGFWSWDSWKHAVALASFDETLAKESIRSMFDFQNASGMIADCVYHDSIENNWRDTKPPLAAWAVWKVFEATGDTSFVKEMYPRLLRYHNWWYKYRDNNSNGFCEYGSTDGTLIAAKWESGMDNAVRFDNSAIRKNKNGEWSLDQESVDLNVYLQQEKVFLSKLASVTCSSENQNLFNKEAEVLAGKILTYFWSDAGSYFMDYNYQQNTFIPSFGPEGWLPLWASIANKVQAQQIEKVMTDPKHFNTNVPLPTLDLSNPAFDPEDGYWRGPVWLDQFYFGVEGLRKYGYEKEASEMTFKMLSNSEGLLDKGAIRENYHPATGKGLNADHFSWSAAMLLLLLTK